MADTTTKQIKVTQVRSGIGGTRRQRCRHGRTRCQKALPQEIATTRRDGFDLPVRQEVFRRLLQVPRLFSQIAH